MSAAANTRLTPEAVALVQQAANAMHKALALLALADGRQLTLTDLHRLTGPVLRSATCIKRAAALAHTTRNTIA